MLRINIKNRLLEMMKTELSEREIKEAPDYMPVVGYEWKYEVGKDGSVWSLNYHRTGQRKQLASAPNNKCGHLGVVLCKDGERKNCHVHQLVLNAYLSKPSEDLEVLHKNSVASDNRLENLKWDTHKANMNDEHFIGLMTNHPDKSMPVLCVETGVVYPSVHEASRQTGIKQPSISNCINGKYKTAGGFHWQKVAENQ